MTQEGEPEHGLEEFFEHLSEKHSTDLPFRLVRPDGLQPVPPDVTQAAMDRWAADGIIIWELVREKKAGLLQRLRGKKNSRE